MDVLHVLSACAHSPCVLNLRPPAFTIAHNLAFVKPAQFCNISSRTESQPTFKAAWKPSRVLYFFLPSCDSIQAHACSMMFVAKEREGKSSMTLTPCHVGMTSQLVHYGSQCQTCRYTSMSPMQHRASLNEVWFHDVDVCFNTDPAVSLAVGSLV